MTIYTLTQTRNRVTTPLASTTSEAEAKAWCAMDRANNCFPLELDNVQGLGVGLTVPTVATETVEAPASLDLRAPGTLTDGLRAVCRSAGVSQSDSESSMLAALGGKLVELRNRKTAVQRLTREAMERAGRRLRQGAPEWQAQLIAIASLRAIIEECELDVETPRFTGDAGAGEIAGELYHRLLPAMVRQVASIDAAYADILARTLALFERHGMPECREANAMLRFPDRLEAGAPEAFAFEPERHEAPVQEAVEDAVEAEEIRTFDRSEPRSWSNPTPLPTPEGHPAIWIVRTVKLAVAAFVVWSVFSWLGVGL